MSSWCHSIGLFFMNMIFQRWTQQIWTCFSKMTTWWTKAKPPLAHFTCKFKACSVSKLWLHSWHLKPLSSRLGHSGRHTEFHLAMSLIIIDVLFGAFAFTASTLTWYDLIWFDMVWYSLTVTHPRIPLVLAAELLQWLASSHWFADQFGGLRHLRVLEPGISSPSISRNVEEHHDAMVSK